jgi:transposase InsO family protein
MASRALDDEQESAGQAGWPTEWFTAAELADLRLPGLPYDKRSINRRAQEARWSTRTANGVALVRPRMGRGGGIEFHASLLPGPARLELARRGITARPEPELVAANAGTGGWTWFDAQRAEVRAEAERRLRMVNELELLEESGLTRSAAISEVARRHATGSATLWNWLKAISGIAPSDRLPALAPRRKGGGVEAEIEPLLWAAFKSDYLRLSAPTLASVYARVAAIAKERGMALPSERAFRRKLDREVDGRVIKLRREGEEALRRSVPAQRRTVDHLHALEHVNVDGHKFDVFVKLDDGRVIRPIMVAIQDIASSKVLAWRIDGSESAVLTRLAFAELFRKFGIPKACTLDNGRAFASKWITGGAKSRFRFKIREEEPTGLLTALGIKIHWALPYRGQSKPIERSFRDMCDSIAKHPAMEGAYTGNTPMAKPENYGSRAIPFAEFVAHVDQGIAAHNARLGRRGRTYRGRSFDQVFAESYAVAPIGKATPEQLRLALLAAEQKTVNRLTGVVELYGNRYWSQDCHAIAGQKVTVRFDPDALKGEVHLYGQDGRYLTTATLIEDSGFDDVSGAHASSKRLKEVRKLVRDAAEAEQLLAAEEVAAIQADALPVSLPEPGVIRPVRHRQTAAALKPAPVESPQHTNRVFGAVSKLLRVVE